jgi:hypothetical protein
MVLMVAKVLHKEFGLGVFISRQTFPDWLSTTLDLHHSSRSSVNETTVAFLTLPSVFLCDDSSNLECDIDEYQENTGLNSHMSMLVDMDSLQISESQEKKFAGALKLLDLKPFVHPVQMLAHERTFLRGANRMRLSKTSPAGFNNKNSAAMRMRVEEHRKGT